MVHKLYEDTIYDVNININMILINILLMHANILINIAFIGITKILLINYYIMLI